MSPPHSNGGTPIIDLSREISEIPSFDSDLTEDELERIPKLLRPQAKYNSSVDKHISWITGVAVTSHNAIAKIRSRMEIIIMLVLGDIVVRIITHFTSGS